MVAFELVKERGTHEPDADAIKHVTSAALANGLVLLSCGYYGNTIRILAPLTMSDAHLNEGLDKLEISLRA
jgi:4-aminobutyrate aminotransferase/(S)-3-amino-2-methylpropionate transaminase